MMFLEVHQSKDETEVQIRETMSDIKEKKRKVDKAKYTMFDKQVEQMWKYNPVKTPCKIASFCRRRKTTRMSGFKF